MIGDCDWGLVIGDCDWLGIALGLHWDGVEWNGVEWDGVDFDFGQLLDEYYLQQAEQNVKKLLNDLNRKSTAIYHELRGRLDTNHDGRISKSEFVALFGFWFERKMEESLREML